MSCDKDCGNGEKVIGEFRLGTCVRIENHELDAMVAKDLLHELECKATQAVAVGNHNVTSTLLVRGKVGTTPNNTGNGNSAAQASVY